MAIQRLRFANEGSIRENIKEFIKRLVGTEPPTGAKPDALSTEERLRSLLKLLEKGLIKRNGYDHKKRKILEGI